MSKIVAFLALMAGFLGLLTNPSALSASDTVQIVGISNLGVVETIVPEPEPEVEEVKVATIVAAPVAGVAYEYAEPEGISIGGRVIPIYDVDSTVYDAGNHVNRFGKLLYGHNSGAVFARLNELGVGSTFTIREGGEAITYVVAEVAMFEKNQENGRLQIDGSGNYMNSVAKAWGHSVALMTCAGTPLGGGDATHRLVVFADAL
ncbi:sortase [Candidatus Saccharibacteria bacterium]|nr:sortase [Candidatus Saccharibacteria bacterium]